MGQRDVGQGWEKVTLVVAYSKARLVSLKLVECMERALCSYITIIQQLLLFSVRSSLMLQCLLFVPGLLRSTETGCHPQSPARKKMWENKDAESEAGITPQLTNQNSARHTLKQRSRACWTMSCPCTTDSYQHLLRSKLTHT